MSNGDIFAAVIISAQVLAGLVYLYDSEYNSAAFWILVAAVNATVLWRAMT